MLKQLHISDIYYLFLLGATFLIIIALLITFYWKISVHMIGIGGMLGALIGISFRINVDFVILIALTVLCSGIVGFARLKLNTHKPLQIYTGFLSGVIIMLLVFLI